MISAVAVVSDDLKVKYSVKFNITLCPIFKLMMELEKLDVGMIIEEQLKKKILEEK